MMNIIYIYDNINLKRTQIKINIFQNKKKRAFDQTKVLRVPMCNELEGWKVS